MAAGIVEVDAKRVRYLFEHDRGALYDWLHRHDLDESDVSAIRVYPLGCVTEVDVYERDENGRRYLDDRRSASLHAAQRTITFLTFDDPAPIEHHALIR